MISFRFTHPPSWLISLLGQCLICSTPSLLSLPFPPSSCPGRHYSPLPLSLGPVLQGFNITRTSRSIGAAVVLVLSGHVCCDPAIHLSVIIRPLDGSAKGPRRSVSSVCAADVRLTGSRKGSSYPGKCQRAHYPAARQR